MAYVADRVVSTDACMQPDCLDVSGASGENGQTGSCVVDAHRWVELSVIGVLMALDAMGRDDVTSPRGTLTSRVVSEDRCCPTFTNCVQSCM